MHKLHGAGPFLVVDKIPLAWAELHGEPGDFVHTSAYGQWGPVMIELVQQDVEGPSPFRDMYQPGEQGIHHMATMVPSLGKAYEHYANQGYKLAARAETLTGTEFAFVDTRRSCGHMIEIYEATEQLVSFYEFIKAAAVENSGALFIER